jgi:hypothetical protein
MYCANCASPLAPGVSFCNRCGYSLKERDDSKQTGSITAFLTAITLVGIAGLGIMLGGSLALRIAGGFPGDGIAFFMLLTFIIVGLVEILLFRQLSRLTGGGENKRALPSPQQMPIPAELRGPSPRTLGEPVQSVTEHTTRTLDYSREDPIQ